MPHVSPERRNAVLGIVLSIKRVQKTGQEFGALPVTLPDCMVKSFMGDTDHEIADI